MFPRVQRQHQARFAELDRAEDQGSGFFGRHGNKGRLENESFNVGFGVGGNANNKLPIWAYMKETIPKKRGVSTVSRHADGFFHQGAYLPRQARFKNLRQQASVFLEIGRFLRLSPHP